MSNTYTQILKEFELYDKILQLNSESVVLTWYWIIPPLQKQCQNMRMSMFVETLASDGGIQV